MSSSSARVDVDVVQVSRRVPDGADHTQQQSFKVVSGPNSTAPGEETNNNHLAERQVDGQSEVAGSELESSQVVDSQQSGGCRNRSTINLEKLQSSRDAKDEQEEEEEEEEEEEPSARLKQEGGDLSGDNEKATSSLSTSAVQRKKLPMVNMAASNGDDYNDDEDDDGQEQQRRQQQQRQQQQVTQCDNNNSSDEVNESNIITIVDIITNNNNSSGVLENSRKQLANHQLLQNCSPLTNDKNDSKEDEKEEEFEKKLPNLKTRRLGYCQALLLRKWPCLALSICIMSSLIFGILLSALTIYLLHDVASNSCGVSAAISANHHTAHDYLDTPTILSALDSPPDSPMSSGAPELAGKRHLLTGSGGGGGGGGGESNQVTALTSTFTRLPQALEPMHYNLFIWPRIAEPFNFTGSVEILLRCKQTTDNITLHALELHLNESSIKLIRLPAELSSTRQRRRRRRSTVNLTGARVANNGPVEQMMTGSANKTQVNQEAAEKNEEQQQQLKVKSLSQDKRLQYSIIHLDEPLEQGRDYLLKMDFVGTLNDDLAGFYKSKYERADTNQINWIAATQFQATDARRAFPCFDEPHFKATFSIKIKHWKNMTALSNMPITNSEQSTDGVWITDTFAQTRRMSTYLVAWAVTNFESRTDGNITVWARPGSIHAAEYALQVAGKILRHYEDFFGIEYPLPKMDMIALPDFNAGAMENWGLITYRETAMLWDESSSALSNKQRVATVVAHELAHQWFGNLVTPKWWDDLWLNEGFASYVEYIGVNFVEPKWKMLDQFVLEELQDVLSMDSLSSTHRISVPVNDPDEISEIFDHISYSKGASVIRMMMNFIGEDVFKLGLQRYLRALKYSNAEQADLWVHLNDAQRVLTKNNNTLTVDVASVMNSWTLQAGYPLVTLTRNYEQDQSNLGTLEQVRFRRFNANVSSSADNSTIERWEIPITFTWQSDQKWEPKTRLWMHANETSGQLPISRQLAPTLTSDQWILLNTQAVGYYRVNYDQRNWKLLIDQLQKDHTKISTINRAQILNDLFELARSSVIDYTLALEATKYLKNEREFLPWSAVLEQVTYVNEMLARTPLYGEWEEYFGRLVAPLYARYKDIDWTRPQVNFSNKSTILKPETANKSALVPYDENDALELYTHIFSVTGACLTKDSHCLAKLRDVFGQFKATGVNNIKPAMRISVYCAAMRRGTKDDWDFLMREHDKTQSSTERARIISALGCSQEMWILARYLDLAFNKTGPIRRQDTATVFRTIASNNYGRDLAFNYLRENWVSVKENFGASSFNLGYMVRGVGTLLNTQTDLDQFKVFYESVKNDLGTSKRSFLNSIEEVESNVIWRNKNYKILADWLHSNRQARAATAA